MGLNEMMEIFTVMFEIQNGDLIRREIMEAPRIMLQQQFMNYMNQAAYSSDPIRVKMKMDVPIWSQYDNRISEKVWKNNIRTVLRHRSFLLQKNWRCLFEAYFNCRDCPTLNHTF